MRGFCWEVLQLSSSALAAGSSYFTISLSTSFRELKVIIASATDVMSALLPMVMCRKDLPEAAEFLDQFVGKARHSGLVRSHVVIIKSTNHKNEV